MVEIIAALIGSAFTAAIMGTSGAIRGNMNSREVVTRLTVAVENVATKLEDLHADIKVDRKEVFGRMNAVEQRVSVLEVRCKKLNEQA